MSENNKELVIWFGPNGDSAEIVQDVRINFNYNFNGTRSIEKILAEDSDMSIREKFKDFDKIFILKSCDQLYIMCSMNGKEVGELYIPIHIINGVWVDYKIEEENKSD